MAFSDYKSIAQVQQEYGITYCEINFINAKPREPTPQFLIELAFNLDNIDVYTSEGARSEMIIGPVLREIYKHYYREYSLWIRKSITYNERLTGTPDYIISKRSILGKTVLETPIIIAVEAKQNDFIKGWGQCAAELVAAQRLNADVLRSVYGIVSDGKLWEFGQLTEQLFIKEKMSFTIDHLEVLFGSLDQLFQAAIAGKNLCLLTQL